jgi:hypothetical protein
MPKREIRIVKHIGDAPYQAVCALCNMRFQVASVASMKAEAAVSHLLDQFSRHECEQAMDVLRRVEPQ